MIVVDTNIITYRFIEGDKTDKVIRFQQYDPDWIVPFLWQYEFINVLSTLVKNNYLSDKQAVSIWRDAYKIFKAKEQSIDMEKALLFSIQNKISAYDAQYIILALSFKIKCLTEDLTLLKKFPDITISLDNF
jgi:predicted nucleic acid-binding protein